MVAKENLNIETNKVYVSNDGIQSIVLDDSYDSDYDPSNEELQNYALNMLGMEDPQEEQALLWIAKSGLKCKLPENWRMCQTNENDTYYFNFRTGDSIWEHPLDAKYQQLYKEQSKLRMQGKPFKTYMDEEAEAFITGVKPKKEKKDKKERKKSVEHEKDDVGELGGLTTTRGKGKFGNLPTTTGLGKGKLSLGGDEPLSAAALGRQALPGLGGGGLSREGKSPASTVVSASPGLTSSTLKTPLGTASSSQSFNASLGTDDGAPVQAKQDLEEELKSLLAQLRSDHTQAADEAKRQFEQKQKRLKYSHEQDMQDLDMNLEKQRNNVRRSSAAKQSEWERQLEEQNSSRRQSCERQLNTEFKSWRSLKDTTLQAKKEHIETEQKDAQSELEKDNERSLNKLERDFKKKMADTDDSDDVASQLRDVEKRKRDLHDTEEELRNRSSAVRHELEALDRERKRLSKEPKEAGCDLSETRLSQEREIEEVTAANAAHLEGTKGTTTEEQASLKEEYTSKLGTLQNEHDTTTNNLQERLSLKREQLLNELSDLEEELTAKKQSVEELRKSSSTGGHSALHTEHSKKKQDLENGFQKEKANLQKVLAELREESAKVPVASSVSSTNRPAHAQTMEELKQRFVRDSALRKAALEEECLTRLEQDKDRLASENAAKITRLSNLQQDNLKKLLADEERKHSSVMNSIVQSSQVRQPDTTSGDAAEKLQVFLDQQRVRYDEEVLRLSTESARSLECERQRIEEASCVRLSKYREEQERELRAAFSKESGRFAALLSAQSNISDQIHILRNDFDREMTALSDECRVRHDGIKSEADARHKALLHSIEQDHKLETLRLERQQELALQAQSTSKTSEERRLLEATHDVEMAALEQKNSQQIAAETAHHEAELEELRAHHKSELTRARQQTELRQQDMLVAKVKRHAASMSETRKPRVEQTEVEQAKRFLKTQKHALRKRKVCRTLNTTCIVLSTG